MNSIQADNVDEKINETSVEAVGIPVSSAADETFQLRFRFQEVDTTRANSEPGQPIDSPAQAGKILRFLLEFTVPYDSTDPVEHLIAKEGIAEIKALMEDVAQADVVCNHQFLTNLVAEMKGSYHKTVSRKFAGPEAALDKLAKLIKDAASAGGNA